MRQNCRAQCDIQQGARGLQISAGGRGKTTSHHMDKARGPFGYLPAVDSTTPKYWANLRTPLLGAQSSAGLGIAAPACRSRGGRGRRSRRPCHATHHETPPSLHFYGGFPPKKTYSTQLVTDLVGAFAVCSVVIRGHPGPIPGFPSSHCRACRGNRSFLAFLKNLNGPLTFQSTNKCELMPPPLPPPPSSFFHTRLHAMWQILHITGGQHTQQTLHRYDTCFLPLSRIDVRW